MEKIESKSINRVGYKCEVHCKKYPCFGGIENLSSEFVQTCQDYDEKPNLEEEERSFLKRNREIFERVAELKLWDQIDIAEKRPRLYSAVLIGVKYGYFKAIVIKNGIDRAKRREIERKRKLAILEAQNEEEVVD